MNELSGVNGAQKRRLSKEFPVHCAMRNLAPLANQFEEHPRSGLALLSAIEASLEGSRNALLSFDLAGIVMRTREQDGLSRALAAFLDEASRRKGALSGPPGSPDLRIIANRIQYAARVQSALLARSGAKLRVMANMLAGTSMVYGPRLAEASRR